ncbi:hypothetical protein KDW_49290 [Dictyobacter vulcani]|uniref:Methylamine utilisation protein MauE domain-containing protein n=1 Tax=Dictyobacter vulcani TaxID=2607529 RepID=A0A5J4KW54_9CHLR|nr:MauE/DoxX family redox-associated membrane protein [Dictyobacter vulcani]GER90767.1 hypothetical protein KDW_49290 [Dictyobacter vulcani]
MAYSLWYPYVTVCVRWLIACIFLVFTLRKLPNRPAFVFVVMAYRVLPRRWAVFYGLFLPWLELIIGIMLVLGILPRISALLSALLFCSFLIAIGLNMARRRVDLDCGCAGTKSQEKIGAKIMLRNLGLLIMAAIVCLSSSTFLVLLPESRFLLWLQGSALSMTPIIVAVAVVCSVLIGLCVPLGRQMMQIQLEYEAVESQKQEKATPAL